MTKEIANPDNNILQPLIENISKVINEARRKVATHINATMTQTYWQVGKYIVEYEQGGQAKVAYGTSTLTELSRQLTARFGRGFSRPNLVNMRKFYLLYPNCQTASDILTWSHICELMQASLETYRTTLPWSGLGTIVGLTEDEIDAVEDVRTAVEDTEVACYDLQGRMIGKPQKQRSTCVKDINIIRMSDGTTRKVLVK